jgi:hypothetical protein
VNGSDEDGWDDTFVVGQGTAERADEDGWDDTFVVGQSQAVAERAEGDAGTDEVPDHTVVVGGLDKSRETLVERDVWGPPADVQPARRRDRYRPRAVPPLATVASGAPVPGPSRRGPAGSSVADDSRRLARIAGVVLLGVVTACGAGLVVVVSLLASS